MAYRSIKRDSLRALTSEMLPYEVPLPFGITRLYEFLRWLKFSWTEEHTFTVLKARLGKAEEHWLGLIFGPTKLHKGKLIGKHQEFKIPHISDLRLPYQFRSRRNNGKSRVLSVPHPQSMIQLAGFIHEHRDSVLYFTNRSNFSIRHPHRVATLQAKPKSVFDGARDRESYGVEQSDREYSHVSSYFSYRQYNNINRFFGSSKFQACERKFPHLMRTDVSKCFDSIYTHTISWVTNGVEASKSKQTRRATIKTFGGKFDHLMQYLNYAETSGIVIGPEFSRIFAEIILQEVDIRVEQELVNEGLTRGTDYEAMRYVDDYFFFLADPRKANLVEEVLAKHLSTFKLHLNEQKQRNFDTPLQSSMSVAKIRIREDLNGRTKYVQNNDGGSPTIELYFSSQKAILDYKGLLLATGLKHEELANSYLYELSRRRDKTVRKVREQLEKIEKSGDKRGAEAARIRLTKYLSAVLEVAVFIYSGAPSVSHGIKLARIIAGSLGELEINGVGRLQTLQFRENARRELLAQLNSVKDEASFGVHTLLLIDCLIFIDPELPEDVLIGLLEQRRKEVRDLDAFGVLTFLRRFVDPLSKSDLKTELLKHAKSLIEQGKESLEHQTSRTILMLSLATFPGETPDRLAKIMDRGISENVIRLLQASRRNPSTFSWNASDNYYERLILKSALSVY